MNEYGGTKYNGSKFKNHIKPKAFAFTHLGYDYCVTKASEYKFVTCERKSGKQTISLNGIGLIYYRASFDKYPWKNPRDYSAEPFEKAVKILDNGMNFIVCSSDGVLENVINIVGYENLCVMLCKNERLATDIFVRLRVQHANVDFAGNDAQIRVSVA